MKDESKEYSNGEVTVVWKSRICIHAANCANGLHAVFDPKARPWINMDGAGTDAIVDQVKKCPSGALSYYMNAEGAADSASGGTAPIKAVVKKGGPLLVQGSLTVVGTDGIETEKSNMTAFCRCGLSANKPYCDGSHKASEFDS